MRKLLLIILPLSLAILAIADERPPYLEPVIDSEFGSKIVRVTGDPGTPIKNIDAVWNEVARHQYSKQAAWNADQSLLLLSRHDGFPSKLFLDGATYEPLFGRNAIPGSEIRWHPTEPDRMVYVKDDKIGYWNVREDTTEIVAEIGVDYSDFHIGPWEGNLSRDGRMLVVSGVKAGERIAFAYDLVDKEKYPDLTFDIDRLDWVSVSASGKYIVLNGSIEGGVPDQTQIFDLEGNKIGDLWSEAGRPSHYDLTLDENGEDIAVGVSKVNPDDGRVIKRRLRDGAITVLTDGGYASHVSARNVDRPGWVFVTYQHPGPTWPPYWDEVIAVKIDGSMTVQRIAKMHTYTVDYLTEAHAVPSPDGRRVLWASSWDADSGRPIGAYVAELPNSQD